MRRSEHRILTTHVGSLPRSAELGDLLIRDEAGEAIDKARLARLGEAGRSSIAIVVARQTAAGIDIVNDGEQPRVGFQTYVAQRMKGFGGESRRPSPTDYANFPDLRRPMGRPRAAAQQGSQRAAGHRRRGL